MLVTLEATAGPIAGRKIDVHAGSILRIGRTAKSDHAIGEDSYLSGLHFSVECDGAVCRVRDLGSSNGTFVNGERITEKVVAEGDSLVAGGTTFQVHVRAEDSPVRSLEALRANTAPTANYTGSRTTLDRTSPVLIRTDGSSVWPGFSRAQSLLLDALYTPGDNIYAVLDASRDSRIPAFLDASGEPYSPLDPSQRIPAFVVALPPKARLLDVLIKDGWSRGWGFYCGAHGGLDEVCAHWRSYVFLRTQDGRGLTLRLWDPRIVRALAPAMPAPEAAEFFGPVSRLILEGEKAEIALEISNSPTGGRQRTIVLL